MGKSTISMVIFNSFLYVYQAVYLCCTSRHLGPFKPGIVTPLGDAKQSSEVMPHHRGRTIQPGAFLTDKFAGHMTIEIYDISYTYRPIRLSYRPIYIYVCIYIQMRIENR